MSCHGTPGSDISVPVQPWYRLNETDADLHAILTLFCIRRVQF